MAVLLVRHAEAGDRHQWEGPDTLRPLTPLGAAQAEGLVATLADYGIARILSSPYVRCTQTVAPIAAARGLTVEPSDDLAEGAGQRAVTLVRSLVDGPDVALCTHGDVMERLLDDWGIRRAEETGKGATWVLGASATRFLPPPD